MLHVGAAAIDKVGDFFDAIDSDDVERATALMGSQGDPSTLAIVVRTMEESDGEHRRERANRLTERVARVVGGDLRLVNYTAVSGTPVPDLSIEVHDLDAALARVRKAKVPIEYGPADEPWACAASSCAIPSARW